MRAEHTLYRKQKQEEEPVIESGEKLQKKKRNHETRTANISLEKRISKKKTRKKKKSAD